VLIDLHTHSAVSDGTQSPAQVVHSAAEAGLDVLALTDHDTTAGWASAAEQALQDGVRLVRGMEISSTAGGVSVHLLSYLHDPEHPGLLDVVERTRRSRLTRAERMVELLAHDVDIRWDDVRAQVQDGGSVGRPHIADALVARGVVRDRTEAFAGLLSARGGYYVRHYAPDALDAVRLVVDAGGVAVMAHPMAHLRGRVVGDEVIVALAGAGLAGLEVFHRDNDNDAQAHLLELSQELDLLVTGSSDYHGTGKPNRLAENTTEPAVLAEIESRATGSEVVG
jgi:predicted metal-dependent phosphoesterase TrpH